MNAELFCSWVKTERGDRVQITSRPDNTGILFAEIPGSPDAMEEALIFAAAPKLLEACKAWLGDLDRLLSEAPRHEVSPHIRRIADQARAAIAQAEGKEPTGTAGEMIDNWNAYPMTRVGE